MRFGERTNQSDGFQKRVAINLVEYRRAHRIIGDVRIKQNQPRATQFERRLVKVAKLPHAGQLGRHVGVGKHPCCDCVEQVDDIIAR